MSFDDENQDLERAFESELGIGVPSIGEEPDEDRGLRVGLTEDDVRDIRELVALGESQAEVARHYGVSGAQINKIVHYESWDPERRRRRMHGRGDDARPRQQPAKRAASPLNADGHRFDDLCTPWYQDILMYARKLTMNMAEADDLVQGTMERALKAWPKWTAVADPSRCARAWLHRSLVNHFINEYHAKKYKRQRAAAEPHEIILSTYGADDDGRDPRDLPDGLSDEVTAALAKIDPRHREMIERCDVRGQSYGDIAHEMKVPIGTVMSGLHRTRKKLMKDLADYAETAYRIGSDRAAEESADAHPAHGVEADADSVEGVVAGDDRANLVAVKA